MPADTARADAPTGSGIADFLPAVEVAAFTRERVDRVMLVSVAFGCVAISLQALLLAFGDDRVAAPWNIVLMILAFVPIVFMVVSYFLGRFERIGSIGVMTSFTAVLLAWPFATASTVSTATGPPWTYFLLNVATVGAVLTLSMGWQIVVTIGIPVLYGAVRMMEVRLDPESWLPVALEVCYALILGSVLLTLAWTFRSAARDVDERRVNAVSSYARAAAVAASERERVAVAALMHDSVLAALIAAARADSPREQNLAVSMARDALTRLANTDRDPSEGSDAPVPVAAVIDGLDAALPEGMVVVSDIEDAGPLIPGRVARALVLAATQAISNAVTHADGVGLRVVVVARCRPASVVVRVSDEGPGFDVDAVPADRLGIRASIRARIVAFGGRASIQSGPTGTQVVLEWRGE